MWKVPAAVCCVFTLCTAPVHALELKNPRAVYGLFGPERTDKKFLPGDVLHLTFDIADIQVDPKTGMARYHIAIDLFDGKGALTFNRGKNNEDALSLGGNQLPGLAEVLIGTDQPPGKYTLKVTVKDLLGKSAKDLTYDFEVQPETFGFVRLFTTVAGLTGNTYKANFAVTAMGRDDKKKPNVEVQIRVLDEAGKPLQAHPFTMNIPKDLPDEVLSKIDTLPHLELEFPLFLNRPGRFTIEMEGIDHIAKKTARVRFPLTVVDAASFGAK